MTDDDPFSDEIRKNVLLGLMPVMDSVARSVARAYPGVDSDDIYQELAVFVLKVGDRLDLENERGCRYLLTRTAHIFAGGERAAQLYSCSQYNYRPADVRRMLENALRDDREAWPDTYVPDDAKSIKSGTDALDLTLDVRQALDDLSYADSEAIWDAYGRGNTPLPSTAERKRLDRAVERLCEALNGYSRARLESMKMRGHPGARRVLTNAQAQAKIGEAY